MWRIVHFKWWVRDFFRFIRRIPGYRRLDKDYGYEPDGYAFIISEYERVLCELTGGKLSKPTYSAEYVITTVEDRYAEIYEEND